MSMFGPELESSIAAARLTELEDYVLRRRVFWGYDAENIAKEEFLNPKGIRRAYTCALMKIRSVIKGEESDCKCGIRENMPNTVI